MAKVCLIVIDGLRDDTARRECGYLQGAVEAGQARRWTMQSCLPTISAPLYETLHTGLAPIDHGILSNEGLRASTSPNVFSVLKAEGRVTGAVAHSFFHTLYGGSAFDAYEHAEIVDPTAPVPHARYYTMQGYCAANAAHPAELDLCAQTWRIARDHAPDYLLLHTCSCDTLGHWFTANSKEYRIQAGRVDRALSELVPRLRGLGYEVLVTADHGINDDGHHTGDQPELRAVPFYAFCERISAAEGAVLDQRSIAPTVLALLDVTPPQTMTAPVLL